MFLDEEFEDFYAFCTPQRVGHIRLHNLDHHFHKRERNQFHMQHYIYKLDYDYHRLYISVNRDISLHDMDLQS